MIASFRRRFGELEAQDSSKIIDHGLESDFWPGITSG